jgi:hypothetical protein
VGKNKKNQVQRRQRKAQKRKAQQKKDRGLRIQAAQNKGSALKVGQAELDRWKQDPKGFGFWATHGINYISSDYEQGHWDPVFPGLYEGDLPEANLVESYISEHINPDHKQFTRIGRTLLGWWFSGEAGMYALAKEAIRRAKVAGEDPLGPAQGSVWEMFSELHQGVTDKMGDQHLLEEERADVPG